MSERFKKVYELQDKQYCSAVSMLINAGNLLLDMTSGKLLVQLSLTNLSSSPVESVKGNLELKNQNGEISEEPFDYNHINAKEGEAFGEKAPLFLKSTEATEFSVHLQEVAYCDGTVVPVDGELFMIPTPTLLSDYFKNKDYEKQWKLELGEDAKYITDAGEGWQRCTCGIICSSEAETCVCGRSFSKQKSLMDETQMALLVEMHKDEEQAAKKEIKKKKRKKWFIILPIIVLLVCGLGLGIYFFGIPFVKLLNAKSNMETGKYEEANKAFSELEPFVQQFGIAKEQVYLSGQTLFSQEHYWEGYETFKRISGYKDSDAMANKCRYRLAQDYLKKEDYDAARTHFVALNDYDDSRRMAKECSYQKAQALFKKEKYEDAQKQFDSVGDYQDALIMVKECKYRNAVVLVGKKEYSKALPIFVELDGYNNSWKSAEAAMIGWENDLLNGTGKNTDLDAYESYAKTHQELFTIPISESDSRIWHAHGLFARIVNHIQDHKVFDYWDDGWNYTNHSEVVLTLLRVLPDFTYDDDGALVRLFSDLASGDIHPVEDWIKNNRAFIAQVWDYDFMKDFVSKDEMITEFLVGNWQTSGGGYYIKFEEDHHCWYNLPWNADFNGAHYDIKDGVFGDYTDGKLLGERFRFTFTGVNTMNVYDYYNGQTYSMYR